MTLPRPPIDFSAPIPNQPFDSPEVYYLESNQGHVPLGEGLYIDPRTGAFTNIEPSPYIYCTPAYPELPPSSPPYGCETEVNTAGVTNFTEAWQGCEEIVEFPCVDSSSVTSFQRAWQSCYNMVSFPSINSSLVTDFSYAWDYCESLSSFPVLDTRNGVNFGYAWEFCRDLETFPTLDFSNAEEIIGAWYECNSLVSFPEIYTSQITDFTYCWYGCESLTSFPLLDTSNGEIFNETWGSCQSLTSFPLIDVSSGTQFDAAWGGCSSLTTFPSLDFGSGTSFQSTWGGCSSLTTFPLLDVSSGTNFIAAWSSCTSLTTFPLLDVSSGTNFGSAWSNCTSLTSFPLLDVSSGTNFNSAWANCTSLTTFPAGMFDSCSATNFNNAWQNCALNQTSVDNILVSLDTAGQSNGTVHINGGTSSAPGTAGLAAKASLEGKGWTVLTNNPLLRNIQFSAGEVVRVNFNLDNVASSTTFVDSAGGWVLNSFTIDNLSSDWYKCTIDFYAPGAFPNNRLHFRLLNSSLQTNYIGDGVSGFYIWTTEFIRNDNGINLVPPNSFSSWPSISCSLLADQAIAPNGTLTADSFTESVGPSLQKVLFYDLPFSLQAGSTYKWSLYVKRKS